ncbi:MAG: hypothetical protein J6X33_03730 [Clostridiales bacterium]|nr:hypothetical protein [Clostridiales bacterium]
MHSVRYLRILRENGDAAFGGSQMWIEDLVMQGAACGIVAGLDRILETAGIENISMEDYMAKLAEAGRYIKPIMLPFKVKTIHTKIGDFMGCFGVSAGRLKRGIRKLGQLYGVDIRLKRIRLSRADEILIEGRKVILLIKAPLGNVSVVPDKGLPTNVGFHWVTAYAQDEDSYKVQSWGREHKILRSDLKNTAVFVVAYEPVIGGF